MLWRRLGELFLTLPISFTIGTLSSTPPFAAGLMNATTGTGQLDTALMRLDYMKTASIILLHIPLRMVAVVPAVYNKKCLYILVQERRS